MRLPANRHGTKRIVDILQKDNLYVNCKTMIFPRYAKRLGTPTSLCGTLRKSGLPILLS